jgi:hypothetical protein
MRFFRSLPDSYEQVRSTVNAAWGLPANGQTTAFSPASESPVLNNLVYLSVRADHCQYEPIASLLPGLLDSGVVEEVGEAEYLAACAAMPSPL